jgi:hypothetical protein
MEVMDNKKTALGSFKVKLNKSGYLLVLNNMNFYIRVYETNDE